MFTREKRKVINGQLVTYVKEILPKKYGLKRFWIEKSSDPVHKEYKEKFKRLRKLRKRFK